MKNHLLLIISCLFIISCNEEKKSVKIEGLWLVKEVKVGNIKKTPVAKWMKFNKDATQASGNGWLQHSVGTWSIKNKQLSINNTNGIEDNSTPFQVKLENSIMTWSREEEGEIVTVFLKRIDKTPTSDGNKLMGLWERFPVNDSLIFQHSQTLHLRWDNTFVQQRESESKKFGIYKIHGHKPELQMINYGKNPEFKFYKFRIKDSILTLTNTNGNEELKYSRIHQFPQ